MEMSFFNIQDGLGEAFARNFRRGLLQPQDYQALSNCETLDDLKMALCNNPNTPFQGDDPRGTVFYDRQLLSVQSARCLLVVTDFGYKDWLEDWEPEVSNLALFEASAAPIIQTLPTLHDCRRPILKVLCVNSSVS